MRNWIIQRQTAGWKMRHQTWTLEIVPDLPVIIWKFHSFAFFVLAFSITLHCRSDVSYSSTRLVRHSNEIFSWHKHRQRLIKLSHSLWLQLPEFKPVCVKPLWPPSFVSLHCKKIVSAAQPHFYALRFSLKIGSHFLRLALGTQKV